MLESGSKQEEENLEVEQIKAKMGFELTRFEDVDEELICPICSGVLEEPLQVKLGENTFDLS